MFPSKILFKCTKYLDMITNLKYRTVIKIYGHSNVLLMNIKKKLEPTFYHYSDIRYLPNFVVVQLVFIRVINDIGVF